MIKKILFIFTIVLTSLILIITVSTFTILNIVSRKTNRNPLYFLNLIKTSLNNNQYKNKTNLNFMILGLDERNDRLEKTETTDTIIFASLNLKNQKLKTISLPRDLWDYDLKTKINGIYPLSLESSNSSKFIKDNFGKILGQKIDYSVVITTNNLIDFVKVINGVDVNLANGFKDEKYPNPDYITNPKAPIYKTIEFKSGLNHLDASNITEFVRSRKSAETAAQGGTDIGRIERQQQLIEAIIAKIKSKSFISNYSNLINLYNFWHKDIKTDFGDQQILDIGFLLQKKLFNFSIQKIELSIGLTAKDGIIYHPETFINKQWVFIPSDSDFKTFHQFIFDSLK
jgi:LCP family protein required for cell wall assembly